MYPGLRTLIQMRRADHNSGIMDYRVAVVAVNNQLFYVTENEILEQKWYDMRLTVFALLQL